MSFEAAALVTFRIQPTSHPDMALPCPASVSFLFFAQPAVTHRGFNLFNPRCDSSEGQEKAGLEQEQAAKLPVCWRLWRAMKRLRRAWREAAHPTAETLPAAWKVSTAALFPSECRLQKHQAVMRRAQFPVCSVLPHGQAARGVSGLRCRSTITSSLNKGREGG